MTTKTIYLDYNSTAPISDDVVASMNECFAAGYLNPASPHREGRRARQRLEESRRQIAESLGACTESSLADRLVFTSGGTESNNLALRGMAGKIPGRIVVSSIEHPSIAETADDLAASGFDVVRLPVDSSGVVRLDRLEELLVTPTRVVSVMLGNNETGAIQPVREVVQICRRHRVPVHTDAVQVVGKQPLDFTELGVSAMTFTAHKLQGPRGIGGLLLAHGIDITPVMHGGSQQLGTRPGTESVALAAGMQTAIENSVGNLAAESGRLRELRDMLQKQVSTSVSICVVNGVDASRLPHTLNLSFPGLDRQALLMALDREGVACSTGSACASGSQEPSPVLLAMGCPSEIVGSSVRISLGSRTTPDEVHRAGQILIKIVAKMASF